MQAPNQLYAVHYSTNGKEMQSSQIFRGGSSKRNSTCSSNYLNVNEKEKLTSPRASKKMGKRNIKAQVKRFKMETKAAKTLGVVVGEHSLNKCKIPMRNNIFFIPYRSLYFLLVALLHLVSFESFLRQLY